jgi:superfamily II RNA helicase
MAHQKHATLREITKTPPIKSRFSDFNNPLTNIQLLIYRSQANPHREITKKMNEIAFNVSSSIRNQTLTLPPKTLTSTNRRNCRTAISLAKKHFVKGAIC